MHQHGKGSDHKSVLKEYYARYLTYVRGLSDSSVRHYFDALNNISRRLKEKELVKDDIYEIADLEHLNTVREILYADPDFVSLDERGNRMYSAGLNNYCRFAEGAGFREVYDKMIKIDVPVAPESAVVVEQTIWKRSGILRAQTIELAGYACEINPSHQSFIAEKTKKPYMEGHHAIPINKQNSFKVSLDVYANIICLCPICHRRIHYGLQTDRVHMANQIYDARVSRLVNSGIKMSKDEFVEVAVGI